MTGRNIYVRIMSWDFSDLKPYYHQTKSWKRRIRAAKKKERNLVLKNLDFYDT